MPLCSPARPRRFPVISALPLALLAVTGACMPQPGSEPGDPAGTGGTGRGSGGAAAPAATGGAPAAQTGGAPATGSGGAGGAAPATGGGAPATGGAGGGAAPDDAAPADQGGTETTPPPAGAKPSEGCMKPALGATGARTFAAGGNNVPAIISLPPDAKPGTPLPLGFALHGFGRTHEHCRTSDCPNVQNVMGGKAMLVYLKSVGAGWETTTRAQNLAAFPEILATLKKDYCVDESRVFVMGTSSGAAFTNVLGCKHGDKLRLVAPVAGPADNAGCVGNPAAMVIHGISDGVTRGENARNLYAQRNGCTTTTVPPLAELRTKISAARSANRGEIACATYQGCTKAPVTWCEHSYGGYDNSTHGWPPPGAEKIWEMLQALP